MVSGEAGARVSASQVEAFLRCNRYWYQKSVLKLSEPFSPAAQKGTRVHSISEYWLRSGLLSSPPGTSDEDLEIAQAAIAEMPPRGPELLIEHEFTLPTYPGGPIWLGYIDLVDPRGDLVAVLDHKTRSDLRYALKPDDLLKSVQMTSYAKWAMDHFKKDEVLVGHKYVCTKRTKTPPHYKTLLVTSIANRKQVETVWAELMPVVAAMVEWRRLAPETIDTVEPNSASCSMYGGCAFKPQCGFGPNPSKNTFTIRKAPAMSETPSNGETKKLSLSEKLAAKKLAAGTPPLNPPSVAEGMEKLAARKAAAAAINAVVPPDAPPDLPPGVPPEEKPVAAEKPAKKAKKGAAERDAILAAAGGDADPPGTDMKKAAEHAVSDAERGDIMARTAHQAAVAAATPLVVGEEGDAADVGTVAVPPLVTVANPKRRALTIFVGCFPVKGCKEFTLFEDWAAPLFERIAADCGLPDYRLITFAGWKAHLAVAIRANLDTLPAVLVMSEYGPGVQEALDALTPHATMIVKKLG